MRILVAEDDAPLADFLCQELHKEHFAVQVVADGIEAQELALNQHYDLVILDLDVYINYLRRKVDFGYDRALIRTIRGVGYQIGESAKLG